MKRRLLLSMLFVWAGVAFSLADTDAEVNARKNALAVAGAVAAETTSGGAA